LKGSGHLFLGDEFLFEWVNLVGANAFREGFGDSQVKASEQLSYGFSLPTKQHRHSLTAVMGNRYTPDAAYIGKGDLAILHELPDVRQSLVSAARFHGSSSSMRRMG
jgi:hypothetical protein